MADFLQTIDDLQAFKGNTAVELFDPIDDLHLQGQ
jgi:hypothetical protein